MSRAAVEMGGRLFARVSAPRSSPGIDRTRLLARNPRPRVGAATNWVSRAGWKSWPGADTQELKPHIYVDTFDAVLNMALYDNGVALVSDVLARSALASGQLVRAHDTVVPSEEGYYVRVDEKNEAAIKFRNWLLDQGHARAALTQ